MTKDIWTISPDEAQKKKYEAKPGSRGIPCPKRNLTGTCYVCPKVDPFSREEKGTVKKQIYQDKKAGCSWFLNCLIPAISKEKVWKLEIGAKAGSSFLDGISDEDKNWKNMAHVKSNKGFLMNIKKQQADGQNFYEVYKGEVCDWDVSDKVLNNLNNLNRPVLSEGILSGDLFDDNYMHIKELKMDDTLKIRVLPHWDSEKRSSAPLEFVWRHWGFLTREEVDGTVEFNPFDGYKETEDKDIPFAGGLNKVNEPDIDDRKFKEEKKETPVNNPQCFGSLKHYDPNSPECKDECKFFDGCRAKVKESL